MKALIGIVALILFMVGVQTAAAQEQPGARRVEVAGFPGGALEWANSQLSR